MLKIYCKHARDKKQCFLNKYLRSGEILKLRIKRYQLGLIDWITFD